MPFKTDWRKYSQFRSYVFPLGAAERGVSGDGNDGVGRGGNGKRKGNDCFFWRFGRRAPCGMVLLASRRPPQLQVCPLVGVDSLEGFIQKPWIWIPGTSNRGGGGGRGVQRCVGVTRPVSSPVVCWWTDKASAAVRWWLAGRSLACAAWVTIIPPGNHQSEFPEPKNRKT